MDWSFAIGLLIGALVGVFGGGFAVYSAFSREISRGWVICDGVLYTTKKGTLT